MVFETQQFGHVGTRILISDNPVFATFLCFPSLKLGWSCSCIVYSTQRWGWFGLSRWYPKMRSFTLSSHVLGSLSALRFEMLPASGWQLQTHSTHRIVTFETGLTNFSMAMNAVKQCGFIMIYHPGKLLTPPGRLKTNSRVYGVHMGEQHMKM